MTACFKYLPISVLIAALAIVPAHAGEGDPEEATLKRQFTLIMRHIDGMEATEASEKLDANIRIKGTLQYQTSENGRHIRLELADIQSRFNLPEVEKRAIKIEPFSASIQITNQTEQPSLVTVVLLSGQSDSELVKQSQYVMIFKILDMLLQHGEATLEQPSLGDMGILKVQPYEAVEIEGNRIATNELVIYPKKALFEVVPDIQRAELKGFHLYTNQGNNYRYRYRKMESDLAEHAINYHAIPADRKVQYLELMGNIDEAELFDYLDYYELILVGQ